MSEYQRYEFMTIDRPLTRAQLDEVNSLSSHIEASSTHAIIEYHWGDFKHDPIKVLHEFFDGFLYWANWGSPELALRFPHGTLPVDLIEGYDFDDFVTFTRHSDDDILDIHFGEMEGPDEWIDYELGSLISIRDELMEGDLRSLYIAWLASQPMIEDYDEDDEDEDFDEDDEDEDYEIGMPPDRCNEYLIRLAHNEPGLSRLLVRELRELGQDRTRATIPTGERVLYTTLLTESKTIKAQLEQEERERERVARLRHLQEIHDHQDVYWNQVNQEVTRSSGPGYDEALRLLIELRGAADQFKETQEFQERFRAWVRPHLRRPAFIKRLQSSKFAVPEA
jgi:hypothetical protein